MYRLQSAKNRNEDQDAEPAALTLTVTIILIFCTFSIRCGLVTAHNAIGPHPGPDVPAAVSLRPFPPPPAHRRPPPAPETPLAPRKQGLFASAPLRGASRGCGSTLNLYFG